MPESKKRREYREALEASAIGLMFPLAIGLGALWGWWMDRMFGTAPWMLALFTVFGVIAAFLNLFRMSGGQK
jgi:ATP synthase protein I